MAAAHGALNVIRFKQDGNIAVEPIELSRSRIKEIESHLMLVYAGSSRLGTELAAKVITNLHDRATTLKRMHRMVEEGVNILRSNESLNAFGELLHEGWMLKQSLAGGITTPRIDRKYQAARANGAIGGKLMGAGSTGFLILFIPPNLREKVRNALDQYLIVPFSFEYSGSTIIYNDLFKQPQQFTPLVNVAHA